ncbi:MAG: COX15/CtaA family protein [Pseudomonadota bacterium]
MTASPIPRSVAIWLLGCCAMVAAMVVIGGAVRLTDSGLSITEWQPVMGAIPPLTEAEWQAAFENYRQILQYKLLAPGMTLSEFKSIFWWEYAHRLWGRLIALVFLLPFLWFLARKAVQGALAVKLLGVFAVGGLEGALGWAMVASGLDGRLEVSPTRLAAHLGLALAIYGALLWIALGLLWPGAGAPDPRARRLAGFTLALASLVFVVMLSGALVAGLDAGMIYNTFPWMDGRLVPAGYFDLEPWWRNGFENVAAVQFNHRLLGLAALAGAIAVWAGSGRAGGAGKLIDALLVVAALQVALGISTLILVVPVALAVAHQAGGLALFTLALASAHALRRGAGPGGHAVVQ